MKNIQAVALIGCRGLISTAQPLILPEDIGLIAELWMDELSPPTLLPPPRRELSQTGDRARVPPAPELILKSPVRSRARGQTETNTASWTDRCRGGHVCLTRKGLQQERRLLRGLMDEEGKIWLQRVV